MVECVNIFLLYIRDRNGLVLPCVIVIVDADEFIGFWG